MIENILEMIKDIGQGQVVENPEIPNEHNNAVMAEAAHSVTNGLQDAIANGQGNDIMQMFATNNTDAIMSSPVAQNIQGNFLDAITSKIGINKGVATGLAASIIPMIMSKLVNRTNSTAAADSGFSLNGLIGSLIGGGGAGGMDIGNLISQFTGGGGQQQQGGLNIGNLINQFTGGGQQQNAGGGSGLANIIQGFFGK